MAGPSLPPLLLDPPTPTDDSSGPTLAAPPALSLSSSVLVLNRLYMAVHTINVRRAFCLLYRDLAEVIHFEDGRFTNYSFGTWLDLSDLHGISNRTLEMHFKLYEGYVRETNRLNERIAGLMREGGVDRAATVQPRTRILAPGSSHDAKWPSLHGVVFKYGTRT